MMCRADKGNKLVLKGKKYVTSDKGDYFGMTFFGMTTLRSGSEATSKIFLNISSKMVVICFEVHWLST